MITTYTVPIADYGTESVKYVLGALADVDAVYRRVSSVFQRFNNTTDSANTVSFIVQYLP